MTAREIMNRSMKKPKQKPIVMIADIKFIHEVVFCFVGTDRAAIRRKYLVLMKKRKAPPPFKRFETIFNQVEAAYRDTEEGCYTGLCIYPADDCNTPYIWLPEWSSVSLVHEIVHAVAHIMQVCNLEDGEHSEVRAYMTDYLFQKFTEGIAT